MGANNGAFTESMIKRIVHQAPHVRARLTLIEPQTKFDANLARIVGFGQRNNMTCRHLSAMAANHDRTVALGSPRNSEPPCDLPVTSRWPPYDLPVQCL